VSTETGGERSGSGAIGFIDSGVGGLTVLHECLVSLPREDFLYIGDSGHFPYGTKTPEELRERARVITNVLLSSGVKMIVVACNSATSAAGDLIREIAGEAGVPVVTVIGPEAEIAAAITESGRVGVLATPATVSSGAYHRALEEQGRPLTVTEVAAPDLAPIIQEGFPFDQSVMDTVRAYCDPLREAEVDTLILGCTHYPLVAPMLQRFLGRDVRLVTAGHAIAAAVQRRLSEAGELDQGDGEGGYRFLVTGDVESFTELGTRFLQLPLSGRVEALRYA
jgi:glutamate racemase